VKEYASDQIDLNTSNSIDIDEARARLADETAPHLVDVAIDDAAAPHLAALYRTEDIAMAPDGRRALIPSFHADFLVLVDLDVVRRRSADRSAMLRVSHANIVQSDLLKYPHGIAFVDETTALIANRGSELMTMTLPVRGSSPRIESRRPRIVVGPDDPVPVRGPGSVAVRVADSLCEAFVCNNQGHDVTRYVFDMAAGWQVLEREVLIGSGLATPDGIAVSASGRWLAISNHDTHEVLIYAYDPGAVRPTELAGVLRGANYPHGLEFADDDRVLLLTDAGLPYLYTFTASDGDWSGERSPIRTNRVMDDTIFNRGRYNAQEGGPKGLAILHGQRAVVLTSTHQHFCCLLLDDLLPWREPVRPQAASGRADATTAVARRSMARVTAIESELAALRERCLTVEARLASAEAALTAAQAQCAELATEREALAAQIKRGHAAVERATLAEERSRVIEQSTIWRASKPLRGVLDTLRRR
jgi:hypothetical protein